MLILTAEEVRQALPMNEAIEAMKRAYASLSEGTAEVPLRTRLPLPGSEALSLFMPAYVRSQDGDALAIKIVSLFPTNPERGLAYIQAAVLAFDPETGQAIALLEGSSLTVNQGVAGFSIPDEKGVWKGLDVDTAKAIAAAVLGGANKVKYTALTAVQRLPALQSKEVDVLCPNTTATLTRETVNGLNFVHPNYYDGQGFLIPKKLGVKSAKLLKGATVCTLPGTTTEMNAADFFRKNGMQWKPVVIENNAELNKAFFAGRCDSLTSDASQLAAIRSVAPNADDYIILPEIISKEPLAPAVRHGDDFFDDFSSGGECVPGPVGRDPLSWVEKFPKIEFLLDRPQYVHCG